MAKDERQWSAKVDRLKRFAHDAGHYGALADAVEYCRVGGAIPEWLAGDIKRAIMLAATSSGWLKARRRDMRDFTRASDVMDAHESGRWGLRWHDAYEFASKHLSGTDAEGSPGTMERSYKLVQRRMKTEPWRYYLWLGSSAFTEPLGLNGRRLDAVVRGAYAFADSGQRRGKSRPQRKPKRNRRTTLAVIRTDLG
jgi:hypothetical protein